MGPYGRDEPVTGPPAEPRAVGPGHVIRMQALIERHPQVTWLSPGQAGVHQHTATWLEVSADPRIDGTPVTVSRESLGALVDYLIARLD